MGNPWHAVHVGVNQEKTAAAQAKWQKYIGEGELVVIPSPYRHLVAPIREYVIGLLEANPGACLLYTSDAADERSSVDLGGRRIIKKKTTRE